MHEFDSRESVAESQENVCAVLALPRPPEARSATDWYWQVIAGTPFLMRNIINLQRVGLDSLAIFSGGEECTELLLRLSRDKRVGINTSCIHDARELVQMTQNHPVLVLNGGALHCKNEILSALERLTGSSGNGSSSRLLERESLAEALDQIVLGNELPSARSNNHEDHATAYLPGGEETRIRQAADFDIQHERLLRESGLSNDSFMDRRVTRFFSRQLTRLFLCTPLTPNQITLLSLVLGLISALYFFQGTYKTGVIGAGLLLFSAWIDCSDGEIARLKFMESPIGAKLDILCDNLVHFAIFFAIGMGLYRATGQDIFKLLGAFAVLGSLISFVLLSSSIIDEKNKAADNGAVEGTKKKLADQLANRDFIYFLLLMAMIERMDIFLCLVAAGANAFAGYLLYFRLRAILFAEQNPETVVSHKNKE